MSNARMNLFWLIVFGATLPLGVVVSTHLARRSFERVKFKDETIRVKGYAEQRIVSDRAMWSAEIGTRNAKLLDAYKQLAGDRGRAPTGCHQAAGTYNPRKLTVAPQQRPL